MEHKENGQYPTSLPQEVIAETTRRYLDIYQRITGKMLDEDQVPPLTRLYHHLLEHGLIKDGYVAIIMSSPSDADHARKIQQCLDGYGIATELRIVSAHKNAEMIPSIAAEYTHALEPIAVIAVAGRSNALAGTLSANLAVPVISCPAFADRDDLMINLNSSLMMPSQTPSATILDPKNAALFAIRCLNLPRIKQGLSQEIQQMKIELLESDQSIRND